MTKPIKRVDLSKLDNKQRAALNQFITDCQSAAPYMQEMQQAAKTIFSELVKTPQWNIAEGEAESKPRQDLWHVGAPEVNYVDHIEKASDK